jgi:hypothetical protein
MQRAGLWALGIGALVSLGTLAVQQGYAGDNDGKAKCTLATLKGRYLFTATGTLLPSAAGEEPTLVSVAGFHIFDGKGGGQDIVTALRNGRNEQEPVPTPVTYTVTYNLNSDCTGTYTVPDAAHFDIFVSPNGDELAAIATAPAGFVLVNPSSRRVAPK